MCGCVDVRMCGFADLWIESTMSFRLAFDKRTMGDLLAYSNFAEGLRQVIFWICKVVLGGSDGLSM